MIKMTRKAIATALTATMSPTRVQSLRRNLDKDCLPFLFHSALQLSAPGHTVQKRMSRRLLRRMVKVGRLLPLTLAFK